MKTHASWNGRRLSVSPARVMQIRTAMQQWRETLADDWAKIRAVLKTVCPLGSFVAGLVALLLWPPIFLLNLLVLAQVMELFIPGAADPWEIPGVGSLQPLALILAGIIAFCGCLCAVAAKEEATAPSIRWLAGSVCVAAIAFEIYGAWLRGTVMALSDSLQAGGLLAGQSAGVSALIGFLAPGAECVAGILAFSGVLKPFALVGFRVLRMIHHWISLRVYGCRFRQALESTLYHPELLGLVRAAAQVEAGAQALASEAEALRSCAVRVAERSPTAIRHLEAAGGIVREFEQKAAGLRSDPELVAPLPAALVLLDPVEAIRHGEECDRMCRNLRNGVWRKVSEAHARAEQDLKKLAACTGADVLTGLDQVLESPTTLQKQRNRWEELRSEQARIFTAMAHVLQSVPLTTEYDPASREANRGMARDTLVRLAGAGLSAPGGTAPVLAAGVDAAIGELVSVFEAAAGAVPGDSLLGRAWSAIQAAEEAAESARASLAGGADTELILTPGRFDQYRFEVRGTAQELLAMIDDRILALQRRKEAAGARSNPQPSLLARFRDALARMFGGGKAPARRSTDGLDFEPARGLLEKIR